MTFDEKITLAARKSDAARVAYRRAAESVALQTQLEVFDPVQVEHVHEMAKDHAYAKGVLDGLRRARD